MLNRPGFKSSEFIVSALTFAGVLVSALQDYISANTATHLSVYGAAAYVVSRGLAKYEPRSVNPPPPPPAA